MNTPAILSNLPTDPKTGLTLPLRTSLGSSDFAKHSAMVALELEALALKMDRFGWTRGRGSPVQDRLIQDWIDALADFPLDEVRAACRAAVMDNPNRMPNEGHIRAQIMTARARAVASLPKPSEARQERKPVDRARAAAIMAEAGFKPRAFGGDA
jgi:hypothetical protein